MFWLHPFPQNITKNLYILAEPFNFEYNLSFVAALLKKYYKLVMSLQVSMYV